jgi:hypothetical protein
MKRLVIPGASYAEAWPDGGYIALAANRVHTYASSVDVPPAVETLLYMRGFNPQTFAGVNHADHVWEFRNGQWTDHGLACGVNAVLYDPSGLLHVNPVGCPFGSQGFRFFDDGKRYTGDETYNGSHTNGLAEWTRQGDVEIGQSYVAGDAATVRQDGVRRILEPGACRFIRFNRNGSQCAVACWKMQENAAVLLWFDVSEIAGLALEQAAPVPVPVPVPVPQPPNPEPPVSAPDWSAFQNFLRVRWEQDRINAQSAPPDQPGNPAGDYSHPVYWRNVVLQANAFQQHVREWAKDHPNYGLLKQAAGRTEVNGLAIDYACSQHEGVVWSEDVVNAMGTNWSGISNAQPTREARPEAFVSLVGDVPPVPTPTPVPVPVPAPDLESLRRDVAELKSHVAALIARTAELHQVIADGDEITNALAKTLRVTTDDFTQLVAFLSNPVRTTGKQYGHAHGIALPPDWRTR